MCENCTWVHVYFPDRFKGQRGVHYTYIDRKYYLILLSKHSKRDYHPFIFIMENNLTLRTGKRLIEGSWDMRSMTQLNSIISVKSSSENLFSSSYWRKKYTCKAADTSSATEVMASTKNNQANWVFSSCKVHSRDFATKWSYKVLHNHPHVKEKMGHKICWKQSTFLSDLLERFLLFSEWESKIFSWYKAHLHLQH